MNKLKNGEDADLSNLITASAELTASYSNSTEVSYGDKSYTSKMMFQLMVVLNMEKQH